MALDAEKFKYSLEMAKKYAELIKPKKWPVLGRFFIPDWNKEMPIFAYFVEFWHFFYIY